MCDTYFPCVIFEDLFCSFICSPVQNYSIDISTRPNDGWMEQDGPLHRAVIFSKWQWHMWHIDTLDFLTDRRTWKANKFVTNINPCILSLYNHNNLILKDMPVMNVFSWSQYNAWLVPTIYFNLYTEMLCICIRNHKSECFWSVFESICKYSCTTKYT